MKQFNKKHGIHITILILGIIFLIIGICYQIPDRTIPYNYKEYVGGDAYNMIIEASIRGGEIAGAIIAKTIYITFGIALIVVSSIVKYTKKLQQQTNIDNEEQIQEQRTNITIDEQIQEQSTLNTHLYRL